MTEATSFAQHSTSQPSPATQRIASGLAPVVDTSHSVNARLLPLPVTAIRLCDSFWAPRMHTNRILSLPLQFRRMEMKGRMDSFRRAAGRSDIPLREGYYFNDSDVYKWLEAASWTLASHPEDVEMRQRVEETIDTVAAAQKPDGYLNTYFSLERASERWTNFDLHEMYCAGHLFQAAVAHHRATGSERLLEVAVRLADHICTLFGPEEQGKRRILDAHAQVEMALVELFRETGNRRYLEQAQFFLDARGHGLLGRPYKYFDPDYAQDNAPFRDLDRVTGHAVRMMYLDCGATDVYAETGETALKTALDRQWANMVERRLYITGSVGARGDGEAFGKDYQLPSINAYAETCAAVGSIMWNWRLLQVTGEARYADMLERTLYNGMLAGVSLDGTQYYYENPLADDGTHRRQDWFECSCCPPNIARLLASLPGYFASVSAGALWLHLYGSCTGAAVLPGGETVAWVQATDYPWDGAIEITIEAAPLTPLALYLRIPGWATSSAADAGDEAAALIINGEPAGIALPAGSYVAVERIWRRGDILRLTLPMPVRRLVGHPNIMDAYGRTALMRGPLVYCIEQADHPTVEIAELRLPADTELMPVLRPELLGGIVTIEGDALSRDLSDWRHTLYQSLHAIRKGPERPARLTAIPYYAWANRTPGPMTIWIPTF